MARSTHDSSRDLLKPNVWLLRFAWLLVDEVTLVDELIVVDEVVAADIFMKERLFDFGSASS